MSSSAACATCALSYSSPLAPLSEKPLLPGRHLPCCSRSICARCLNQNKRYETYCPYCQISTDPAAAILPQGLREPPSYTADRLPPPPPLEAEEEELPAYSSHQPVQPPSEKAEVDEAPDTLHFLLPTDTVLSLSLAYDVPISALRKSNNLFSDHLLRARRTAIIPGTHYKGGVSLSPRPVEGEEEEARKGKVRRWMVGCKVAEYDVALLYLRQAEWDLEAAMEAYREDERWEREHPLEAQARAKKGKGSGMGMGTKSVGMRRFVGGR